MRWFDMIPVAHFPAVTAGAVGLGAGGRGSARQNVSVIIYVRNTMLVSGSYEGRRIGAFTWNR